jgi:hypothetical protein
MKLSNIQKLYINNIITFIILLLAFYSANNYLSEINYEMSYRNHKSSNEINFNIPTINETIIEEETETLKLGNDIIIFIALSLFLILNGLYYLIYSLKESNIKTPTIKENFN